MFLGACLRFHERLDRAGLEQILEERDPKAFKFDADGAAWNKARVTLREIDEARRQFIKSFGSCSFEEPVEDLRALGLMPVEGAAS